MYNKPRDIRTCIFEKTDYSDTFEICLQGVYIDVSQTKHVIMQIKTLDYMLKVKTKLALAVSLDHSLIAKAHKPYGNY